MSFFVSSTPAPRPKSTDIRAMSFLVATVFLVMVVGQLFTYEDFAGVVDSFWLPISGAFTYVLAAIIVTTEVFALPFLLSMRLSPLMRFISMACGWFVGGFWLFISIWLNVTDNVVMTAGLMGATVDLPVGWWAITFTASLAVLVAWTSWGMWPGIPRRATRARRQKRA